jgi:glycosyltransferase involved in cell wall biosynthesis
VRILLVNDYATPTAGAERLTLEMRDGLRARGHHVRVFASRAQLIPGESFADATCYGTNTRLQTLTSTVNLSAARALEREIRDFAPDVVHVQMFLWQLSPAILPVLRRVPSLYYAMTYKPVCPTGLKWLPSGSPCTVRAGTVCLRTGCLTPTGFGPLMLQRQLWRRRRGAFRTIVCVSTAVQRELELDGIATSAVISPGTLPARARPPLVGPPIATFAGRLTPEKGADVLVRAFRLVRDRVPDARLLLAGSGPEHQSLRALVAELGLSGCVEMPGQLDAEGVAGVLERSWVHAVPSRWPEPFGLSATEAMMRGTAVVASDIGGLADIVEHGATGMRVPAGDETQLADVLARVLSDRAHAERLGAAARARALESFTMDACISRFELLYGSLLNSESVRARVG